MRIRKRPPPLSSSSPLPSSSSSSSLVVSDPQNGTREGLKRREIGEGLHPDGDLAIEEPHGGYFFLGGDPTKRGLKDPPPLSTNPYPTIVVDPSHISTCCITTAPNTTTHADQFLMKEVEDEKEEGEEMVDSRRRWGAQVNSNKRIGSVSSSREKALSLSHMKRKEACDNGGHSTNEVSEENPVKKEKKPTGIALIVDHCTADNGGGDRKEGDGAAKSRRRSPAVLMEGSRCSRVNGRGWRCCQQTLVGYSLCEHHLGKGRLKSMSSVRGRQLGVTAKSKRSASAAKGRDGSVAAASPSSQELLEKPKLQEMSSEADNGKEVLSEEEEEAVSESKKKKKKKKKIGTVKARSISSLLDKTNGNRSTVSPPPPSPPPLNT